MLLVKDSFRLSPRRWSITSIILKSRVQFNRTLLGDVQEKKKKIKSGIEKRVMGGREWNLKK